MNFKKMHWLKEGVWGKENTVEELEEQRKNGNNLRLKKFDRNILKENNLNS